MNQIDVDNAWQDGYESALEDVLPVFKKLIAELGAYRRYDFVEGQVVDKALEKAEAWLWETNND